ncbi:hypothetical protein O7606_24705 [Micromonospora sp. WMMD882]|uniref:hypothetical protein n=1 Tax=Micromonospora sp. WMMD882 TaxID=3015151 RepID=UPI00248C67CC|nr:hypothetical protein [Micromonospora sp. WMMD882]WBB79330.1 hypothetical protein O7606_24705 [Micromonospora sp. WMMD882]
MAGRVLELRVHGVSNTPPGQLLGMQPEPGEPAAQPWLVAGDEVTGFYREPTPPHPDRPPADNGPTDNGPTDSEPTGSGPTDSGPTDSGPTAGAPTGGEPVVVEAYSWGQLTSGARTARDVERALWTLLLPFTLANVALHARPDIPADPDRERWASRSGIAAWLIRLFCLSLTGTLVLAATGIGVDLVGWQCVDPDCLRRVPGPWEFLGHGWWGEDAHALAVGLLLPLGLIALVGLLSWRTYQYEAEMPAGPSGPPVGVPLANPLQDPTFWCGEGQLRRAAVLHLCCGTVVAAAVPLGAVLAMDPPRGARAALAWSTVALLALPVAVAVVALGRPYLTRRAGHTPLGPYSFLVVVSTLAGLAGAVVLLLLPDGPAGVPLADLRPPVGCAVRPATPGCGVDRSLPGYDWIIAWWAVGQLLLLTAIGGVSRSGRRALAAPVAAGLALATGVAWVTGWLPPVLPDPPDRLDRWMLVAPALGLAAVGLVLPRPAPDVPPRDRHAALAWGGRGPALIAGVGWLLGMAYSAGVLYWISNRLNSGDRVTVVPPGPVRWAGLVFAVVLLVVLATAARAGVIFAGLRHREYARLVTPGRRLSAHDVRRCRDVSAFRALHRLVGEHAVRLAGRCGAVVAVLAALGCAAALSQAVPQPAPGSGWGVLVTGAADSGDALLGWLPVLIAALGLLVYRNDAVRRSVGVLWDIGTFWPRAAHPLAPPSYAERAVPQLQTRTAGLLALPEDDPRRVTGIILSGHSQGTVICAAMIFQLPARWRRRVWFFSYGCQLARLYGRVFPAYFGPERLPALADALTDRSGRACWTNFWRDTDPLGWPVSAARRELAVQDPEGLHPTGGEITDPPIRNHGGYPESPEFRAERDRVAGLLRQGVRLPRQGVG